MYEFDSPEDLGGETNFLKDPGTYHVAITEVKEGEGPKGNPMDGFTVVAEVLEGTTPNQRTKQTSLAFFAPKVGDSDGSVLAAKRRMAAFAIATVLMEPKDLGRKASVNLQDAVGRQMLVRLVHSKKRNSATGEMETDDKFLQIDYAAIFHVDDPEVKDMPKLGEAIQLIPKELRRPAEWFAFKAKDTPRPAPVNSSAPAASTSNVDFSDL